MKFETLKTINKKKLIIPIVIISCLIIVVTIYVSHAKFTSADSITIMDDTINYTPYDLQPMAIYLQQSGTNYVETNTIPTSGYKINESKTYCYKDDESVKITGKITTNSKGEHVIKDLPKRSKCYLYFDKSPFDEYVLANSKGKTINFNGTSCSSGCDYNENGIYEAMDDDGISYYYRGTVENNYVKFGKMGSGTSGADIWWRIIRRNGDGSVRMIFAGTSTNGSAPNQKDAGTMINSGTEYKFNNLADDNAYVGYQYTVGVRNGHTVDSNAKTVIEAWFKTNLLDEFNATSSKIDKNAGFCGDRSAYESDDPYKRNNSLGTRSLITMYGAYKKMWILDEPSFECPDIDNDLYTMKGTNKGTKSLTYPIALPTMDELLYAGNSAWSHGEKNYLCNGNLYWTISPSDFINDESVVVYVGISGGILGDSSVRNGSNGIRPVINLTPGSLIYGTGISTDPYRVS